MLVAVCVVAALIAVINGAMSRVHRELRLRRRGQ
jgi:hypothetical protein